MDALLNKVNCIHTLIVPVYHGGKCTCMILIIETSRMCTLPNSPHERIAEWMLFGPNYGRLQLLIPGVDHRR